MEYFHFEVRGGALMCEEVPIEKIVWGSDALFINMAQQIGKVLGAEITDNQKKRILSDNARRILGDG